MGGKLTVCPAVDMYHAPTDTPALCRTSSLVEELGQIEYIFSDKTGTLTCNQMEFRQCSIGGIAYADVVEESKRGEVFSFSDLQDNLAAGHETARVIREFLTLLATCHTVIPEYKNEKITYQASSPDEAALVQGADVLGYTFVVSRGSPSRSGDQGRVLIMRSRPHSDPETAIRFCQYRRQAARVSDLEHPRVQLDAETHVGGRPDARRQDQVVLQGCRHGHL